MIGWLFGLFDWLAPRISAVLLALYGLIFGAPNWSTGCNCRPSFAN